MAEVGFVSEMNYVTVANTESVGKESFGIKIQMASSTIRDLTSLTIDEMRVLRAAVESIESAFTEATNKANPARQLVIAKERGDLVNLFTCPIFVEEIPNGYCSRACCKDKPWLIVTTKFGRIKIGWRKSVISIDWSQSTIVNTAEGLFPDENVTKDGKLIHAWGLASAGRYIKVLESQY